MIRPKPKRCKGPCGRLKLLWARGMCKECDAKINPKDRIKKSTAPIAKLSGKRKKEMAEYLKLRLEFLNTNPLCQARLVGCTMNATDVHHMAGRIGSNLTDVTLWKALCRACHHRVEMEPAMAKELGLSASRL